MHKLDSKLLALTGRLHYRLNFTQSYIQAFFYQSQNLDYSAFGSATQKFCSPYQT